MSTNKSRQTRFLLLQGALLSTLLLAAGHSRAYEYPLPSSNDNVVGEIITVVARDGETLLDIARRHKVGYEEIRLANPGVDTWLPGAGTEVVVPKQFVLPDAPREGIVVNVPEMRLYYYPKTRAGDQAKVITYPISVGRGDWETPLGVTEIIRKDENPVWRPPESIRAEHAADGDYLPKVVPPGPENPLGKFALRLGLPAYLIHGTNKPYGIGMRVTHGCMRLYPEDIDALFSSVSVGTRVRLVNQPAKAGWLGNRLYVEVHPAFGERMEGTPTNLTPVVTAVLAATGAPPSDDLVQWEMVYAAGRVTNGIPVAVSQALMPSAQARVEVVKAD